MKGDFNNNIEVMKNQIEILEMKSSASQINTSIKSLTNRVEQDEKGVLGIEDEKSPEKHQKNNKMTENNAYL
jgi:predicted  nucleic acid-binding Zn-ribbon protein